MSQSNKKIGNDFEREFAELLFEHGFWVHVFAQNKDGQPADIIAVKNKKAYLIDCKVCSTKKGFDISRMEENQDLSMDLWRDCCYDSSLYNEDASELTVNTVLY